MYSSSQLPILMPPIQPVLYPMDIYQGNEASDGSLEGMGHQNSDLHRRHAATVRVQGDSSTTLESVDIPPRFPRLHSQQGEVYSVPIPGAGVPRVVSGFTEPPAQVTHRENEADPQVASMERINVSTTVFPVPWKIECSFSSYTGSSSVLQEPTRISTESTAPRRPEL